jgi:hypothetical protein
LPVVSAPAGTQRGAVKNLKQKMKTYLDATAGRRELSQVVNDAGYRGWIGERELRVDFNDSVSITLPLPRLGKE